MKWCEEMGLAVGELGHIGGFLLTPGGSDELCELYVGRVEAPAADADGVAGHAGMADEHEDIRVRVWPAAQAIEAALAGRMANSVAAIGLLWLAARRAALRKEWRRHDGEAVSRRSAVCAPRPPPCWRAGRTASCWTAPCSTPAPAASQAMSACCAGTAARPRSPTP